MNKMKFLIFSFLLSSFSFSSSFGKIALTDFKSYAKTYQEYPRIDNKDFLNPDFTTFYKKMMPGFFSKAWNNTLSFLHLKEKPFWSVDKFKALLLQLVEKREKGNFIYKFSPKEGSKFIIWGDLQGAFHSLTRCLEELKKQGVIDEDLKIIKPAHYLVFNGDLVNRSAYSLETLFVVMTLMQQNPDKVFYMRGNNEDKEMWHSYGLKRELDIKAQSLSGEDKDLLTLSIDKFFNTLPLALFLRVNGNDEFVCISHRGLEEGKVEQAYFAKFLKDHFNGEVEKLNLDNATITSDFVNIEAIVKGISRSSIYLPTEGLSLYLPDHGATAWTILSSPTTVYQKMYNFYFDSFAEIEVCKNIYEWKISSFNQDARKKDGFKTHSYYLVSSQPTDLPQSKGKITVGCAKDFSTSSVVEAITLIHGLFAKLSKLNEEGGVGGKYIKLVILNDGYDPAMGIKAAEDFINLYKTDITLASFGSPTLKACLPMLKEGKLLVMFPWTGAPIFFDPNLPNVFHDKASYLDEGRILTDYAIKKLKAKKIAIFYQDDEFGRGAMIGARKTLAKYGIKDFVAISHKPEVFDFSQQTKNILNFDPDAILFSSFFETTKNFIRQVGVKNLEKKELLFISDFATDSYQEFLKNKGLRFTVAQIYPSIKTSKFEIIKDFKKEIKDVGYLANSYSLEGYIAASIFVDVIKRIDGEVTKEKIIKIIEGMKDYNLGGLNLTFNPQTKSLVDSIWLDNGKKWIKWSD